MSADPQIPSTSTKMLWAGRVVSALPVAMLVMSGIMKFMLPPEAVDGFKHLGWPTSVALALGIIELGSTILYAIPQTAVLGAILLTGYLGGAIATHVRIDEAFVIPAILGVLVWLGLFLRGARLRALLPLRSL